MYKTLEEQEEMQVDSCFCYCCFIYNAFSEGLAVKCARVFFFFFFFFFLLTVT